jgi:hypothetical protein
LHDSAEKTLAPLEDKSLPDDGGRWSAKPDVIESEKDLVTKVIHADDDPSLNPWTFRM